MPKCLSLRSALSIALLLTAQQTIPAQGKEDSLTVAVSGNRVAPSAHLTDFTRKCLSIYDYSRQEDERRRRLLDECLRLLRNDFGSRGYMRAKVEAEETAADEGRRSVALRVNEGARYLLGEVRIEGVSVLTPEFVRSLLPAESGETVDGVMIGKWLYERLKREYGKLGYIQYSPELTPEYVEPETEGGDGVAHMNVTIDEGKQFSVRRVELSGNQKTDDDALRRLLSIREGEVFNQEEYEQSIARLNESGWFEEVSEKDVHWKASEEDGKLELRITVKEK